MIEIKHLTKVYKLNKKQMAESKTKNPLKTAVDDLSLKAEEGEIYGLLGPNGAGKTTTLRCIATLIKPTKGEIYVNSHEVQKEPESVRESIGFLTSDIKLDEQFDVDYMFGFFGRLHNIPKDRLEKRKEELFSYFGIQDFAHKKIKELSTGMKQKAAIAVSLVHGHSQIVQSLFLSILHEMKIVHSYQFLIIEQLPEVMIYLDMYFLFPIYLPQE